MCRLQHIADFGGISVGHLAYHFNNKDCIVETLYDELKETQELYEFRLSSESLPLNIIAALLGYLE